MTSTNGKIPAGSVSINCSNLRPGASDTTTSMIEKCPDKSATVNYTLSLEFLRSISKSSNKTSSIYGKNDDANFGSGSRVKTSAIGSPTQNYQSA